MRCVLFCYTVMFPVVPQSSNERITASLSFETFTVKLLVRVAYGGTTFSLSIHWMRTCSFTTIRGELWCCHRGHNYRTRATSTLTIHHIYYISYTCSGQLSFPNIPGDYRSLLANFIKLTDTRRPLPLMKLSLYLMTIYVSLALYLYMCTAV